MVLRRAYSVLAFSIFLILLCGCSLLPGEDEEDDTPTNLAVRLENRGTYPVNFTGPGEDFEEATVLRPGLSRFVRVRGVKKDDGLFFEAAIRETRLSGGFFWMQVDARQCFFDGDRDKPRTVYFRSGLGCENW